MTLLNTLLPIVLITLGLVSANPISVSSLEERKPLCQGAGQICNVGLPGGGITDFCCAGFVCVDDVIDLGGVSAVEPNPTEVPTY